MSIAFLAVTALAALAYMAIDDSALRTSLFALFPSATAGAILVGVRRNHPVRRSAWLAIAAGAACFAAADATLALPIGATFPSPAQGFLALAYPFMLYGALSFARAARSRRDSARLDAAIIAVALAMLIWQFLIEPATIVAGGVPALVTAMAVGFPALDVLLVAVLVPLVVAPATRSTGAVLLAVGFVAMALSDGAYGAQSILGTYQPGTVLDLGWILSCIAVGVAALNPRWIDVGATSAPRSASRDLVRTIGLASAVLVPPALILWETSAAADLHIAAEALVGLILSLLVVGRLYRTMAATERQHAAEAVVVAQEQLIKETANRRVRERRLVADTLRSIRPGDLPEATAEIVCREVTSVAEVAMAVLIAFEDDRDVVLSIIDGAGRQHERRALGDRGRYLRDRAAMGPWVERWLNPSDHPYRTEITNAGVAAHAYAPLVVHDVVVGLLVVGASEPDALLKLTEWLPGLVEFAGIVAALVGPGLLARMTSSRQVAEIRALINGAGHRPVFQPIVDLGTGATVGFEALTRFEGGASPEETFLAAHAAGLGPELELATLERALVAARALPPGAWLDVNVAPATVSEPRLHSLLAGAGREIVLEITEHDEVRDYPAFRAAFAPLAPFARLCVDDAGSGFASLRHLVELGPSFIKLDRSLIAALDRDPARRAAVAGMVHYATAAGAQVVAEGIEGLAELHALRALGVNLGQGYLLGRPAPVAKFAIKPSIVAVPVRRSTQPLRRQQASRGRRAPITVPALSQS